MGLEGLALLGIAIVVLSPIVVLVLQFRVLGQQREANERLESWLPEMRRELRETRRLIEGLAARTGATGAPLRLEPLKQARALSLSRWSLPRKCRPCLWRRLQPLRRNR